MATLPELEDALRNADAAGDTAAAQQLADEIVRMRGAQPAAPAMQGPPVPTTFDNMTAGMDNPAQPSPLDQLGRSSTLAAQAAGRGAANLFGMPMDLVGAGLDLGLTGAEAGVNLFRDEPIELPRFGQMPMGSQHLKDSASTLAEGVGLDLIDRDEMTARERLLGDVTEFATEAGSGSGILSQAAKARFPAQTPQGVTPRAGDSLLKPHVETHAPIARDVTAGAGAGAGNFVADEYFPDSDLAKILLMMGMGVGGAGAHGVLTAPKTTAESVKRLMSSDIPYDQNFKVPSRGTVDDTRRFLEGTMSEPDRATANVKSHIADAKVSGDPTLTTDLASDDIGLLALGRGGRTSKELAPKFEQADQLVLDSALSKVDALKDPGANQAAVRDFAKNRPDELAAERDAAALPIIRDIEKEESIIPGLPQVDTTPVAKKIDEMLAKTKRDPVRSALMTAKEKLNRPGSPEIDTTVGGLYETRKAINDIIEGRGEKPTDRFAKLELSEVRDVLDAELNKADPRFGKYLKTYQEGSRPLDIFEDSKTVQDLAKTDPRNVASEILSGSKYGTEDMLKEVNKAVGSNPEVKRGWRAAVTDVLVDKITNTNTAITKSDSGPLSIAKMANVFKKHEKDLAQVYSADEMNALRRAHKMIEPFGNLSRKATVGSPTADRTQLTNALEAGVLAYTGSAVHTGMIMKRIKTALNLVPGLKEMAPETKIQRLVERMYFDPELFVHVMESPPMRLNDTTWNKKLNQLMAVTEGVKADEEGQN